MGEARNWDISFCPQSKLPQWRAIYPINPTKDEILGIEWPSCETLKPFARFHFVSLEQYGP